VFWDAGQVWEWSWGKGADQAARYAQLWRRCGGLGEAMAQAPFTFTHCALNMLHPNTHQSYARNQLREQ